MVPKQTEAGHGTCQVGGGPPLLPHAEHLEGVNHRAHWSAVVLQHPVQKGNINRGFLTWTFRAVPYFLRFEAEA
jgi:hypothetical protein